MKKIIIAVLLSFAFQANAAFVDLNGAANAAKNAGEMDMLESYKRGLEREKDKAEINVKIAELKLEVEKIKLQLLLNESAIKEMEKK